jgi:hypothetical protein
MQVLDLDVMGHAALLVYAPLGVTTSAWPLPPPAGNGLGSRWVVRPRPAGVLLGAGGASQSARPGFGGSSRSYGSADNRTEASRNLPATRRLR